MSYDVHIGKLISGKRGLEGKGTYLLCTPDKKIQEITTFGPQDGIFVSRKDMENALYDFCKSALSKYIEEGRNKDVYTFSIYTDSYCGRYVIYINNLDSLNQTADKYYARYQKEYSEKGKESYNQTREQILSSLQFSEGDYPFMFEEMPELLESYLHIFSCISQEEPKRLEIENNYIFEKTIVDSELFLIAIDVIHRMKEDFKQLDRTDDFVAYVSAADGVGGDYLTLSQLIRKCVTEEQLHKAMPDVREGDLAFQSTVKAIRQQAFDQQVHHWVSVIEGGDGNGSSMESFLRTDYEAYEQLVELGSPIIPYIEKYLNDDLEDECRDILEMVLEDLQGK
ncbi:protein of unknown function [Paenibacillus tianmuensis]|uniref:DUF4303 domain-containing protein n=1 Tax=Paenibacillus tianmuensis TaxID=624147 RepID=A0A1G4TNB9_9BACL|nr:DUF4303 domain-containing protein [Paenibacillus tianmuensis]SCW82305.1 protein of unknown function [Paenibacillus tianmuensis]